MDTISLRFDLLNTDLHDLLIAELEGYGFETFLEEDDCLKAFAPADAWDDASLAPIQAWLKKHGEEDDIEVERIGAQNWNAVWEASIQPIIAGQFIIKPTWAEIPAGHEDKMVVLIDPKMSFGTGHHESTRLVLGFLPKYIHQDDVVLDAGTGTGVLAIAALKLGAKHALAYDNDEWVRENVEENFELNKVQDQYELRICSSEDIAETNFDVVIANIQRNILLDFMPDFERQVKTNGFLILAGLLTASDKEPIIASANTHGFQLVDEATENEWWSGVFCRTGL